VKPIDTAAEATAALMAGQELTTMGAMMATALMDLWELSGRYEVGPGGFGFVTQDRTFSQNSIFLGRCSEAPA
jgi:hypothetical protein